MREVHKDYKQQSPTGGGLARMGSSTGLHNILSNSQQYEVLYVGKIKVSSFRVNSYFQKLLFPGSAV